MTGPSVAGTGVERTDRSAVLEVTALEVVYRSADGDHPAVRGIDLRIREHEFVGLVGESGSGKSTAALATLGLVRRPGVITGGEVRFDGTSILGRSDAELRSIRGGQVGLIVQNARGALNPLLRVGVQVGNVHRAHHDVSAGEAFDRAVDALGEVGIPDPRRRADAYPHQLSGGMAQRVLIAMATINEPRLLIADEPTTGLDVTVQAQFLDTLQAKVRSTGAAVLFVTHDLGIVAQYCDRVAVMADGVIVEDADVRTLFSNPRHPYAQRLIAAAADVDTAAAQRADWRAGTAGVGGGVALEPPSNGFAALPGALDVQ